MPGLAPQPGAPGPEGDASAVPGPLAETVPAVGVGHGGDATQSATGATGSAELAGGTGGWYLLTYPDSGGNPDAGVFDAQGIAVVGTRIVMLELRNVGQDYNYEAGQEPMVAAVQRAAGKLG